MSDTRAIAVFDSGVGGLTVVHQLHQLLPEEKIIYFGDTLRAPYGSRSTEAIREFSIEITNFLLQKDIKMIIAACNTVSAVALKEVQAIAGGIPVIGVVLPGCIGAIESSNSGKVGVIGTRATIGAHAYKDGIEALSDSFEVVEKACPLLAPLVEEGFADSNVADQVLSFYLKDIQATSVDTLVLGCTHYPLLRNAIDRVTGKSLTIVDSAEWVAKEAKEILEAKDALSIKRDGDDIYYASDLTEQFHTLAQNFLQERLGKIIEASHSETIIQ